jgi:hypothetical protein
MALDASGTAGQGTKLHPPFAQPDPGRRAETVSDESPAHIAAAAYDAESSESAPAPTAIEDLPSIEAFLDDLPSIDDFVDHRTRGATPSHGRAAMDQAAFTEEGWAAADWQSYDWRGAAALGTLPRETAEAQAAWSTTDWGGEAGAGEIAAALDLLAHRIRTGELSLERFRGSPPEAALAAAFAALLRNRA